MSLHRRDAKRDLAEPDIVDALESCMWIVTRISMEDWPDLHCMRGGENFWLEVKTGKRKASARQLEQHDRMRMAGMRVGIAWSVEEALRFSGDLT